MSKVVDDFIPDDFQPDAPRASEDPLKYSGVGGGEDPRVTFTRQLAGIDPFSLADRAKGVLKSLGDTGTTAYQWGRNVAGLKPQTYTSNGVTTATPQSLEAANPAQEVGKKVGAVAQYQAIPGGGSLPAQIAAGGLGAGVIAQGQNENPAVASNLAMAAPIVSAAAGAAWPPVKDWVNKKVTSRLINSHMEVNPKWMENGRDPGQRIIDEKIVASSKDSLQNQVQDRLKDAGTELEAKLALEGQGKYINGEPLIESALNNATRRIGVGSDPQFLGRLDVIRQDIQSYAKTNGIDLQHLTPIQAQRLKSTVGSSVKWHGAPFEGDANQAMLDIYSGLNNAVESAVPGAKRALARYGDLEVANQSLDSVILRDKTRPIRGLLSDMTTGPQTAVSRAFRPEMMGRSGVGAETPEAFDAVSNYVPPRRQLGPPTTQIPSPPETSGAFQPAHEPMMAPATREIRTGRLLRPGIQPQQSETSGVIPGSQPVTAPATREIRTGRLIGQGTPPPEGTQTFQQPASSVNTWQGERIQVNTPNVRASERNAITNEELIQYLKQLLAKGGK